MRIDLRAPISIVFIFLVINFFFPLSLLAESQPIINEIMSSNTNTFQDEDGDYPDWIEIYNPGDTSIDLTGYGLSDRPDNPYKWIFPAINIQPKGYMVVYASGKDRVNIYKSHTNFKINTDGETLVLTNPDGVLCDSVFTKIDGTDISYGRTPDGGEEWVLYLNSTPGESNTTDGYQGHSDAVVEMSIPGGFYDSPITLELSTDAENAEIRYTIDGSYPSETSTLYSSAIPIDTTTVIRARVFEGNLFPGPINTHTYFIDMTTTLPVISLSTNPDNFFDDDIGIYVEGEHHDYKNYQQDWERPIHLEMYEPNGYLGFNIDAGIKIQGFSSRYHQQRSFKIITREKYGFNEIKYRLFPDIPITEFKSIILRSGGSNYTGTYLNDVFCQSLLKNIDLDIQAYRPAVVYINGVYWGLYNIRENPNEDYLASHHGIDPDNVDILDDANNIKEGDDIHFNSLKEYIFNHDISDSANYNYIKTQMDVNNFINYNIAHIFFGTNDWYDINIVYWRPKTFDGKWRWLLQDVDGGLMPRFNNILRDIYFGDDPYLLIIKKLLKNENFKNDFINRFADFNNTIFHPSITISKLEEMKKVIEPEMGKHFARWGIIENFYGVTTIEGWNNAVDDIKFILQRRGNEIQDLFNYFYDLEGKVSIELDNSSPISGSIKINSIIPEEYPWNGIYFKDIRIRLSAIPNPGYRFVGWTVLTTDNSSSVTITLTENTSITANFVDDSSAINTVLINEINYNSSAEFDPEDWVELYNAYDNPIDISGWTFKDENDANAFIIPEGTIIPKDGYYVLARDADKFSTAFPGVKNFTGSFNFGLNNAGEHIRLFDTHGTVVDSLTFDDEEPWPLAPDGAGPTLELINTVFDNSMATNWTPSLVNGTPGIANDLVLGVDENAEFEIPVAFSLGQNYPNPFNPVTTIPFSVPKSGRVTINIYSILGQRVAKVIDDTLYPGKYQAVFNADHLSSGIYFYRIEANGFNQTKSMLLLK
ncbi:CotH kinase family protein [Candidatus Latescibacterota bacterium]